MFVHSGAGLHGHEYSNHQPSPRPPARRLPFLRSALRPLSEIDSKSYQSSTLEAPTSPPLTSKSRPISLDGPPRRPSLATRHFSSDVTIPKDLTVRFREPQTDTIPPPLLSEDEESLVGSELSDHTDASTNLKRRKRVPRKSIRFALAHPAPQLRTKQRKLVQIRPRILLQLQCLGEKRAVPAFDVIPSSIVAGTLIIPKLAKRFPRMFHAKPYLGQNDLLLVRNEDYGEQLADSCRLSDGADDSMDQKDVLAVVSTTSQRGDDCVEIVLQNGSAWLTSPMPTGSYEFTHTDENGNTVTARWVRRTQTSPRDSWSNHGAASPPPPEHKWIFSVIDPSTRRHPIQGVLTSTTLEIYETYNTMSTSSGRYPPIRSHPVDVSGTAKEPLASLATEERTTLAVTEEYKQLMLATAIWISLRQTGWPATSTPKLFRTVSQCRGMNSPTSERSESFSGWSIASPKAAVATQPASLPPQYLPKCASTTLPVAPPPVPEGVPHKATSSGAEFMRRRRTMSSEDKPIEKPKKEKKKGQKSDEETHTCRLMVRQLTQRLFHQTSSRRPS